MASTASASASAAPSNFAGLPAEIQKNILLKYFEDPCIVTFSVDDWGRRDVTIKHRLGPEARIALTNRYFFNETTEALKISPRTVLELGMDITSSVLTQIGVIEQIKPFAANTRSIRVYSYLLGINSSTYQRLAPKLTTIDLTPGSLSTFISTHRLLVPRIRDLRSLVRGCSDGEYMKKLGEKFQSELELNIGASDLGGLTYTFSLDLWVCEYSVMEEVPLSCKLHQYNLVVFPAITSKDDYHRYVVSKLGQGEPTSNRGNGRELGQAFDTECECFVQRIGSKDRKAHRLVSSIRPPRDLYPQHDKQRPLSLCYNSASWHTE